MSVGSVKELQIEQSSEVVFLNFSAQNKYIMEIEKNIYNFRSQPAEN